MLLTPCRAWGAALYLDLTKLQHCTTLHTVHHPAAPWNITLHSTTLHSTALYRTTLHIITLHSATQQTAQHYTKNYTAPQWTVHYPIWCKGRILYFPRLPCRRLKWHHHLLKRHKLETRLSHIPAANNDWCHLCNYGQSPKQSEIVIQICSSFSHMINRPSVARLFYEHLCHSLIQ